MTWAKRENLTLGDLVADTATATPEDGIHAEELRRSVARTVDTLSPVEAKVMRMRFGLDGGEPMALKEIGARMDLTKERIRQIEAKAIRRLRHPKRAKHLREFLAA